MKLSQFLKDCEAIEKKLGTLNITMKEISEMAGDK